LSIVIPARNEEGCIAETLGALLATTEAAEVATEIVVVDDGSIDSTAERVAGFSLRYRNVRLVENRGRHGFGMAVRAGLLEITATRLPL